MTIADALRAGLLLTIVAVAACTPLQLRPSAEAQRVPGMPRAAADRQAGIEVVVEAGAWTGKPEHLDREITPLKVTIDNDSEHALLVSYEDFILETGRNIQHLPLPPLDIRGEVLQRSDTPIHLHRSVAVTPRFSYRGFLVSPWYVPYYSNVTAWGHPWAINHSYFDIYYPRWAVRLPTKDMIANAIPEGVIEAGGHLSGFLYFAALDDEVRLVTFKANLSTADEDRMLATIRVPFEAG